MSVPALLIMQPPRVGFVQGYGTTGTSASISLLRPADHRDLARLHSAARAVMAIEARIVDAVDREVANGEIDEIDEIDGIFEIVARGDTVISSYRNCPAETVEAPSRGWLHTGDVGRMDVNGHIHDVGRLKI